MFQKAEKKWDKWGCHGLSWTQDRGEATIQWNSLIWVEIRKAVSSYFDMQLSQLWVETIIMLQFWGTVTELGSRSPQTWFSIIFSYLLLYLAGTNDIMAVDIISCILIYSFLFPIYIFPVVQLWNTCLYILQLAVSQWLKGTVKKKISLLLLVK